MGPRTRISPVSASADLNARSRNANGFGLDLTVLLQTNVGAGLGLAVELLEVDAYGTVEPEQVRSMAAPAVYAARNREKPRGVAQRTIMTTSPRA